MTLYSITALLILDADGHRVMAKYYHAPHSAPTSGHNASTSSSAPGPQGLTSLKEQKAFEKSVHEKTKRGGGTSLCRRIIPLCLIQIVSKPGLVLYRRYQPAPSSLGFDEIYHRPAFPHRRTPGHLQRGAALLRAQRFQRCRQLAPERSG